MHIWNKKGSILIESMIFLCVLSILITLYHKVSISSLSKCSLYEIKEDIKTMEDNEIELISNFIQEVKNNDELYNIVLTYKEDKEKSCKFPIDNDYIYLKISNSKFFLIKDYDRSNKIFRELNVKVLNESDKSISIWPTTYKIISRSENENGFNFWKW